MPDPIPADEALTIPTAARRLGVHPDRLRRAIRSGELSAYRLGARWQHVLWSDVLRWLRGFRVKPSATAEQVASRIPDVEKPASASR